MNPQTPQTPFSNPAAGGAVGVPGAGPATLQPPMAPAPVTAPAANWSTFADGAPPEWAVSPAHQPAPWEADPEPSEETLVGRTMKLATRIRTYEGLRGYSVRGSVILRQIGAFGAVIACSAVSHWAFSSRPDWRFGGMLMLFSVAFITLLAAVGTVLYAESRRQIIDQCRHFAFGIVLFPGTALALFMRVVTSALGPGSSSDMFTSVLQGNGLPLVYLSVVAIPAFVFAKYIFGGLRSINRRALADEETLAAYMRQDGWQR